MGIGAIRLLVAAMAALMVAGMTGAPQPAAPRVTTSGGVVEGKQEADRIVFRGVPFAAPPLDALRWQPPRPIHWKGVRRATDPAPACLQGDYGWNRGEYVFASEDCLTLDIETPALAGRHPVLVWIHGGSNHAGSPQGIFMTSMVDHGIVVVGVRYRLGTLGFLAPRGAGASGGNYGLMDQIAALRWVQANVTRFGGDPDAVTIGGQSAGAQDVGLLLAAPAARPLFARAIMESGTPGFGVPYRSMKDAHRLDDQHRAILGRLDAHEASPVALIAADARLHDAALNSDEYLWLRATIDGVVLPRSPDTLLADAPAKPLLIGTNAVELDLWGGRPYRDGLLTRTYGTNEAAARTYYGIAAGIDPAPDTRLGSIDQRIATDATFVCPTDRLARLWAAKGAPVYRYVFDAAPGGGLTSHSRELSYVFGQDHAGDAHMQDYWAAFIASGTPTAAWPRWPQRMRFDAAGAHAEPATVPAICELTDAL